MWPLGLPRTLRESSCLPREPEIRPRSRWHPAEIEEWMKAKQTVNTLCGLTCPGNGSADPTGAHCSTCRRIAAGLIEESHSHNA